MKEGACADVVEGAKSSNDTEVKRQLSIKKKSKRSRHKQNKQPVAYSCLKSDNNKFKRKRSSPDKDKLLLTTSTVSKSSQKMVSKKSKNRQLKKENVNTVSCCSAPVASEKNGRNVLGKRKSHVLDTSFENNFETATGIKEYKDPHKNSLRKERKSNKVPISHKELSESSSSHDDNVNLSNPENKKDVGRNKNIIKKSRVLVKGNSKRGVKNFKKCSVTFSSESSSSQTTSSEATEEQVSENGSASVEVLFVDSTAQSSKQPFMKSEKKSNKVLGKRNSHVLDTSFEENFETVMGIKEYKDPHKNSLRKQRKSKKVPISHKELSESSSSHDDDVNLSNPKNEKDVGRNKDIVKKSRVLVKSNSKRNVKNLKKCSVIFSSESSSSQTTSSEATEEQVSENGSVSVEVLFVDSTAQASKQPFMKSEKKSNKVAVKRNDTSSSTETDANIITLTNDDVGKAHLNGTNRMPENIEAKYKYLSGHRCCDNRIAGFVPACCYKAEVGGWLHIEDTGPKSMSARAVQQRDKELKRIHSQKGKPWDSTMYTESKNKVEIPGFYYDTIKRKYFAIIPGTSGLNSGAVTRESIAQNESEIEWKEEIKSLLHPSLAQHNWKTAAIFTQRRRHSNNILAKLELLRAGITSTDRIKHDIMASVITDIYPVPLGKYDSLHIDEDSDQEDEIPGQAPVHCLSLLHNPFSNKIVRIERHRMSLKTVSIYNVNREFDKQPKSISSESMRENLSMEDCVKIQKSYEFVSAAPDHDTISRINCMCFMAIGSSKKAVLLVGDLNDPRTGEEGCWISFGGSPAYVYRYEAAFDATPQCCAFNSLDGKQFAIGTSHGIDIRSIACSAIDSSQRANLRWLHTNQAAVLSLCYGHYTTPNILFAGTKNKKIYMYDSLSSVGMGRSPSAFLESAGGVTNLYLTQNEYHLVAADFSGNISMYDLRRGTVVREFKGHVNDYAVTSFGIDETEDFLYAVGSDCRTRLWDFQTGNLLRTIPPPVKPSRESIPSVCFSQNMGGPSSYGRPGLIMGIDRFLYYYTI